MNALGLILARAGSKGAPGKNIAPIADRPCVLWTIDAAQAAHTLSRIVVSTDDEAVQKHARYAGVDVVVRPTKLATDDARVDDAARHAVNTLDDDSLDPIVILYANAPVRPAGLIDRAVSLLTKTNADSVQSYCPVGKHHPWWTARVDEETGAVSPWEGDQLNHGVHRRQDLPSAFIPDGGVLVVTRRALFREIPGVEDGPHAFFGIDRRGVLTDPGAVVDIDSPIDLIVADAAMRAQLSLTGKQK